MPRRHLELEEAEGLLDVVFGVVVGLALVELPERGWDFLMAPTLAAALPVLLLTSGLIFSAFYWVETRFFLDHQERFDSAVGKGRGSRTDGVRLPLATFLLGSLAMMATAAGMLAAAAKGNYVAFLGASLLYWLLDLGGTLALRQTYRPYWDRIQEKRTSHREAFNWFLLHIRSSYFLLYGGVNAIVVLVLLLIDIGITSDEVWRVCGAMILFIVTILRHLWLRTVAADGWLRRELSRADVA